MDEPGVGHGWGRSRSWDTWSADITDAMEHWLDALDVGPFFYLPSPPLNDLVYRGEPTGARIAVAITYSGDLQVELIQPLDDEPSPYRDFRLDLSGAGCTTSPISPTNTTPPWSVSRPGTHALLRGSGADRGPAVLLLRLPVATAGR